MVPDLQKLLPEVFKIFQEAGKAVIAIRDSKVDLGDVTKNEDGYESVFTIADLASDKVIYEGLSALTPDIPVISEENVYEEIKKHNLNDLTSGYFWIIDPIDGTRHFKEGRNTWAVLGALIHDRRPVLGIVYCPAAEPAFGYYAIKDQGAFKFSESLDDAEQIFVNKADIKDGANIALEVSFFDPSRVWDMFTETPVLNREQLEKEVQDGFNIPAAVFDCHLAEGKLDFSANPSDKCAAGEWDVAAPSLIVEEAGGYFVDFYNQPLLFGTPYQKVEPNIAYANSKLFEEYTRNFFAAYDYKDRLFHKKVND